MRGAFALFRHHLSYLACISHISYASPYLTSISRCLAVGAYGDSDGGTKRGAVYILFLNADGQFIAEQKISSTEGGLAALGEGDYFGFSVAPLGDIDGDGVIDLAVSAVFDDTGGSDRGAVYLLSLETDGTVRAQQKISGASLGMAGVIGDYDCFGSSLVAHTGWTHSGTPILIVGTTMCEAVTGGGTTGFTGDGRVLTMALGTKPKHACAQACSDGLTCDVVRDLTVSTLSNLFTPLECNCGLCEESAQFMLTSPPAAPPLPPPAPATPPPAPPPPPGMPIEVAACTSPCATFAEALGSATAIEEYGGIVVIHLKSGVHNVSAATFNGSMAVGEVRLVGEAGAELQHLDGVSPTGCLLMVGGAGAPRLTLEGVTMRGAVCVNDGGTLTISGGRFEGSVHTNGGALSVVGGSVVAHDVVFRGNSAGTNDGGDGGAVFVDGGTVDFHNCLFVENRAENGNGGALFVRASRVNLRERTLLEDNNAQQGRSLYIEDGDGSSSVAYFLPAPLGRWVQGGGTCNSTNAAATLPLGATDSEYPFACAPGLVGDTDAGQDSPACAGRCPAGKYCGGATSLPLGCPIGYICPQGSPAPVPCRRGTFANMTNATDTTACTTCPVGTWCAVGSTEPTECLPGSFNDAPEQHTCTACPSGTFQSQGGATACDACTGGSFCPRGASAELPCLAGSYSNELNLANANNCTACPLGSACTTGSTAHVPCAPGTFSNSTSLRRCVNCEAGSFQTESGTSGCVPCTDGHYCNEGSAAPLPCPGGTYSSAIGNDEPSDCTAVDAGSFAATGSIEQTVCARGTYTNASMAVKSSCVPCEGGTYQDQEGATACKFCESGAYCPRGAAAALPCEGGSFSNSATLEYATACTPCPVGSACATGSTDHTPCLAGLFSGKQNQSTCDLCAPGKFTPDRGNTACRDCKTGFLCVEGSSAPQPCPGGTHANQTVLATVGFLGSIDECVICPTGTFCSVGSAEPSDCGPGTFNDQLNASTCVSCAAGSFQALSKQTACDGCPEGYFCAKGSASPLPCPGGTHTNVSLSVMISATDCIACVPGKACPIGSAAGTPCLPGSFANESAMEACTLCPAGWHQSQRGQTSCEHCTRGFYCNEGTAKPTPCPGGTSSNASGIISVASCAPVTAGFWAPLGSAIAEPCPSTGFYCPGSSADVLYGGSKPVLVPSGGATTSIEVETVQKELMLDVSCDVVDLDAISAALAAQYSVDQSLINLSDPCAASRRSRSLQSASRTITLTIATSGVSANGTPVSAPPIAELLTAVETISDTSLGASLSAALGTVVSVSSSSSKRVTVTLVVAAVCPEGFWCTAGLTVPCEAGFFNPSTNANNQSACIKCPEHATTLGPNATTLAQCVCESGYYNRAGFGVDCHVCPIGTNCSAVGVTLHAMPIKNGFYRRSKSTDNVRACADASVNCPSGEGSCIESHSGCAGGADASTPCRPGLHGVFCLLCTSANATEPHYYAPASETEPAACHACGVRFAVLAFVAVGAVAAVFLMAFGVRWALHWIPAHWKKEAARRWSLYRLGTKLKSIGASRDIDLLHLGLSPRRPAVLPPCSRNGAAAAALLT